ncbi:succinylarginine dihydrolase [Stigmatella aurantiaca DW4/3-1]|uniref:Succinylarginine dihydrolase n=1 Tax=Stigmatella aurantiaca (strain DW4/3-1) TaxID=378806 RepID=Q08MJ0_STIAD|nr:succinylarginine dihydrolase [Stigmatella aurantiaca DW4/3-1]
MGAPWWRHAFSHVAALIHGFPPRAGLPQSKHPPQVRSRGHLHPLAAGNQPRARREVPAPSSRAVLPDGSMAIIAPVESQETETARRFLERVVAERNPVKQVHYLDLRQSMNNGGGPACLRQRICLTDAERAAVKANVFYTPDLHDALADWVTKHYRETLYPEDLKDPALARETMTALDVLTRLLKLGSVYDFQQ